MSATEAAAASSTPVVDKSDDHAGAHDVKLTPVLAFKYVASLGLMVFSMILVGALIFTENTRVAKEASPWVSLIVLVSFRTSARHRVAEARKPARGDGLPPSTVYSAALNSTGLRTGSRLD